jgi:uncharacterized protein (TIGR03545 family)
MTKTENNQTPPAKKNKGPFRTEVLAPTLIIIALVYLYFAFLFDHNLKSGLEWIGYEVVGAEVDIEELHTSFFQASLHVHGLSITNPEKPTHNMLEVGDIRFAILWDGLLRARFIVNEMTVENIAIETPRKRPGKVKPPEPPKSESHALEKALEKGKEVGESAAQNVAGQDPSSIFSDVSALMSGGQEAQLTEIEKNLPSKQLLDAFQKDLDSKTKKWNEKIKSLPQGSEIDALNVRLAKIKTSNFKNPQEVLDSVKQFNDVINDANSKFQVLSTANADFNKDLAETQNSLNQVNAQINKDVSGLEQRLHLPKIDAKSLSYALLHQYLGPTLAQIKRYKSLAEKYLPGSIVNKLELKSDPSKSSPAPDLSLQPRPREHGVTYEFGRAKAYPLFWVRRISISSKGNQPPYGEMQGEITDISSNQLLTERPTVFNFHGNFPTQGYQGVSGQVSLDTRQAESLADFNLTVNQYGVEHRPLLDSKDVKIDFQKADGDFKIQGRLNNFETLQMSLHSSLRESTFDISTSNDNLKEILKKSFADLSIVTISAKAEGPVLNPNLEIDSNAGGVLQKALERQLAAQIAELKAQLNRAIQGQVGAERAKVESQLNGFKAQGSAAIQKLQDQLNAEKARAQQSSEQSQKSGQQQAQKQLQEQGQKAIDDLRKQFGF